MPRLLNSVLRAIAYVLLAMPSLMVIGLARALTDGDYDLFIVPAIFLPVYFAALAVHELGHAAAAFRFRWPVEAIAVAPLLYTVKSGRVRLWLRSGEGFGGAVICRPVPAADLAAKKAWLAAAGPLANFAFAAVLIALSVMPFFRIAPLFGPIAAFSFFLGLGNLIPFETRSGARSDGFLILRALRQRRSDAFLAKLLKPR